MWRLKLALADAVIVIVAVGKIERRALIGEEFSLTKRKGERQA